MRQSICCQLLALFRPEGELVTLHQQCLDIPMPDFSNTVFSSQCPDNFYRFGGVWLNRQAAKNRVSLDQRPGVQKIP